MCGEYGVRVNLIDPSGGSPPHVWGIPILRAGISHDTRITPTCVGNTLKDPSIGAIPK